MQKDDRKMKGKLLNASFLLQGRISMCATILLSCYTASSGVMAWDVAPEMNMRVGYDDNLRLLADESDGGYKAVANIAVTAASFQKDSNLLATLGFNVNEHFSTDRDDVVDEVVPFAKIKGGYKVSRRDDVGFSLDFRRDYTSTNQVVDDDETDTDFGIVKQQNKRKRTRLSPYWKHHLNETVDLGLDYSYIDVRYDESDNTSLVDYTNHIVSSSVSMPISRKNTLKLALDVGRYDPDSGSDRDTMDTYSINGTLGFSPSEKTKYDVTLGWHQTSYDNNTGDSDEEGMLAKVSGETRRNTVIMRAVIERRLSPSGSGRLIESDKLTASFLKKLGPLLSLSTKIRYFDNESIAHGGDSTDQREFLSVEPGIIRQISRDWSIEFSYRYRMEEKADEHNSVESNAVFLSLKYKPQSKYGRRN